MIEREDDLVVSVEPRNDGGATLSGRAGGPTDLSRSASQPSALIPSAGICLRDEMVSAIYQYHSDLRRPPAPDSVERRLEWIEKIIARIQQEALQ